MAQPSTNPPLYGALVSLLHMRRLPGRLTTEQTAHVLGFQPHDIPVLVRKKLLVPLGPDGRNTTRYFASGYVEELAADRKWLDRATRAVRRSASDRTGTHVENQQGSGERNRMQSQPPGESCPPLAEAC